MPESVQISIAEDFSAYPAGRDQNDGPFHGERFRREILLPRYLLAKEADTELSVSLEGVKSFGSSFLEEAFGGLVRKERVDKRDLRKRLAISTGRPGNERYRRAILRYIDQA